MPAPDANKLEVMGKPYGEPDTPSPLEAPGRLDREIYTVIEQDPYPVEPPHPLPIQRNGH